MYMYIVQMHIKSEVKSFEVRVCHGFTRFSASFAHMVSINAVAYNLCVFEAKHFFFINQHCDSDQSLIPQGRATCLLKCML